MRQVCSLNLIQKSAIAPERSMQLNQNISPGSSTDFSRWKCSKFSFLLHYIGSQCVHNNEMISCCVLIISAFTGNHANQLKVNILNEMCLNVEPGRRAIRCGLSVGLRELGASQCVGLQEGLEALPDSCSQAGCFLLEQGGDQCLSTWRDLPCTPSINLLFQWKTSACVNSLPNRPSWLPHQPGQTSLDGLYGDNKPPWICYSKHPLMFNGTFLRSRYYFYCL